MVYDGENGLGAVVAEQCCRHALRLASKHGLAMVVARHSNHFGMAAFWTRRISAAGHIGIAVCNATPMVPPWQGREPRFGTNPICMSLPGPPEKTWLLDMATTTVAMGKIYNAHFSGEKTIPAGWGLDREGRPTTDPETVMNGGMVAPLGGYKGYGLAMMVEVLCAVLGGGAMSTEVGGIRVRGRPMDVSQTFLAIEVERFLPLSVFQARMERLAGMVKSAPPAAGYDEVLLAGEPEIRIEEQRRRDGIPIPEGTWEALRAVAARLQVPEPG
jgi:LDH2 family malate/lactate/ureidoglycolate dehydrogenase